MLGHYAGNTANVGEAAELLSPLYQAKLQLNGHDRFSYRYGSYFNRVMPYQTIGSAPNAGVFLYSFALRPAEHQPSGTCNFSRIDNATLNLTLRVANCATLDDITSEEMTTTDALALTTLNVYAVNYNVLSTGHNSEPPPRVRASGAGKWSTPRCASHRRKTYDSLVIAQRDGEMTSLQGDPESQCYHPPLARAGGDHGEMPFPMVTTHWIGQSAGELLVKRSRFIDRRGIGSRAFEPLREFKARSGPRETGGTIRAHYERDGR